MRPWLREAGFGRVAAEQGKDSRGLREILDSATRHFQVGNYEQAIVEFQEAYQRRQLPTLLFNIAQAHRKSGHWAEALSLYERFLKDDPKYIFTDASKAQQAADWMYAQQPQSEEIAA